MITNESMNLMINNSGNLTPEQVTLFNKGLSFTNRMRTYIAERQFGKFALNNNVVPLFGYILDIDFEDGSGWNFVLVVQDLAGDKWNLFYTTRTEVWTLCGKA